MDYGIYPNWMRAVHFVGPSGVKMKTGMQAQLSKLAYEWTGFFNLQRGTPLEARSVHFSSEGISHH